jgi:hypothetical protein
MERIYSAERLFPLVSAELITDIKGLYPSEGCDCIIPVFQFAALKEPEAGSRV